MDTPAIMRSSARYPQTPPYQWRHLYDEYARPA